MADSTPAFVVVAEFQIKPGQREAFLALAFEDARRSLADESGCHQFDVLASTTDDTVMLHEVYSDRDAYETHRQMPHYAPFKQGSAPLLEHPPTVRFFAPAKS
ncbi:putative quinol monooxygenase [Salinisphaera sp. T31B1]|uniref:putative quinol monooxygenase n=1 Tax=Salinisphaera sp. T31B1 TaxID=727963 RepID=UPI00333FD73F